METGVEMEGKRRGPDAPHGGVGDLEAAVLRIFREDLLLDVEPATDVVESGVLDSLVFVEVIVKIEERFGVSVAVEELDLEDFRSVRRIAQVLSRHTSASL